MFAKKYSTSLRELFQFFDDEISFPIPDALAFHFFFLSDFLSVMMILFMTEFSL